MPLDAAAPLSAQTVFDMTAMHLMEQGGGSVTSSVLGPYCAYRGDEGGRRCAIGAWIYDHEYRSSMEGMRIRCLLESCETPETVRDRLIPHADLLDALQRAHDAAALKKVGEQLKIGKSPTTGEWNLYPPPMVPRSDEEFRAELPKELRKVARYFALSDAILEGAANELRNHPVHAEGRKVSLVPAS